MQKGGIPLWKTNVQANVCLPRTHIFMCVWFLSYPHPLTVDDRAGPSNTAMNAASVLRIGKIICPTWADLQFTVLTDSVYNNLSKFQKHFLV